MSLATAGPLETRLLRPAERTAALAHLARDPVTNLFLMDLVARVGGSGAPGELPAEVASAWDDPELVGLIALRPSVMLDASLTPAVMEALLPLVESFGVGLIKSSAPLVDWLWEALCRNGRAATPRVDRRETCYVLRPGEGDLDAPDAHPTRPAEERDLDALVHAARESLREEGRTDPFSGDRLGFQRWVRGRLHRARVVEHEGRVVFVGYADVQRPEGWLVQGVYTWPEVRKRGFATAGMRSLCREAFASGAEHIQLAVVEDNGPGQALYEGIGFEATSQLRTILFA